MARKKDSRNPDGRSSIYEGSDGYWHGRVTVGTKPDGTPDRRHTMSKDKQKVIDGVDELEKMRSNGVVPKAGQKTTVAEWLTYWVENIAAPNVRYKTVQGYRIAINNHLIPALGGQKVTHVPPEDFERLYAAMIRSGLKPATAHQVHRTARAAFREARKRKVVMENPFEIVRPPRVEEEEIEPYEPEEVQQLIAAALARRNGVRFVVGLVLGTRKGETIGFRWSHLNRKTKVLRVRTQRQRQTYEHGCADPVACSEGHHRTMECRQPCKRHKKCPPVCSPGCIRHAQHCPERIGGIVEVDVKSKAGRRGIRLPDQLFDLLVTHEQVQAKEREAAGDMWMGDDWMFTQPNGKPLDPRSDHDDWKALLAEAGVRDGRLHDARHTAATVLLLLGVSERAAMDMMGWSNTKVAQRYMHVLASLRDEIASKVGGFIWGGKAAGRT
jgi:integrase